MAKVLTTENVMVIVIGLVGIISFIEIVRAASSQEHAFLITFAVLSCCGFACAVGDAAGAAVGCGGVMCIVWIIEMIVAASSEDFPKENGKGSDGMAVLRAAMFVVTFPCCLLGLCVPCIVLADTDSDSSEDRPSWLDKIVLTVAGLRGRTKIPFYWANAGKDLENALERDSPDFFDEMYPVPAVHREILQNLLDASKGKYKLKLVRALRVEDSRMWAAYQQKAAEISDLRGDCEWQGDKGAPVTVQQMQELSGLSVLDQNVCEAYLWHGTKPEAATKIAEDGFDIGIMAATRFGEGGYFAEDPFKSDSYAKAGEGLYRDCYAILLCRVVLGKQYHISDNWNSNATDKAKPDNDSTVAEPPGDPREFIVFDNTQVYPEYAIVYERVTDDMAATTQEYWDDEDADAMSESIPAYWAHAGDGRSKWIKFDDMYPCHNRGKEMIQGMMDYTWKMKATKDRKGDLPVGIRALKIMRIEDSKMWWEYIDKQEEIQNVRGNCWPPFEEARTTTALGVREKRRLNDDVNEVYLWHGSSPAAVMSIAETDFNISLSGSHIGTMFGNGAYFAECSSKADEYSADDPDGYYKGYYAMLLCRVTLGKMQYLTNADPNAHNRVGIDREFDSTLGDRDKAVGTYREFVISSNAQVYPEYAIIYERVYADVHGRVRGLKSLDSDASARDIVSRLESNEQDGESDSELSTRLLCCDV